MVLFVKSYIHHGFSLGLFALMLSGYFVFFLIESQFSWIPTIYCVFSETLGQPIVWVIFLFAILTTSAFELAYKLYNKGEEDDVHQQKEAELTAGALILTKVGSSLLADVEKRKKALEKTRHKINANKTLDLDNKTHAHISRAGDTLCRTTT